MGGGASYVLQSRARSARQEVPDISEEGNSTSAEDSVSVPLLSQGHVCHQSLQTLAAVLFCQLVWPL
jgi:hypothetical protein